MQKARPFALAVSAAILFATASAAAALLPAWFGTQDFIQYWTAFRLILEGKNPYDAQNMLMLQRSVLGPLHTNAVMMWNPPGLLILLAPVLALPFDLARVAWVLVNFLLFFLTIGLGIFLARLRGVEVPPTWERRLFVLGGFFYPAWNSLSSGQLGILLGAASIVALISWVRARMILFGAACAILLLKPHLFYLFGAVLLVGCWRERRWGALGWAVLFSVALQITPLVVRPQLLSEWLLALQYGVDRHLAVPMRYWRVETLFGWIRGVGLDIFAVDLWNLSIWGSLWCAAVAAVWIDRMYRRGVARESLYHRHLPRLLALSLLCAPYGWFSDYAVLTGLHTYLLANALSCRGRVAWIGAVVAVQGGFLLAAWASNTAHHYGFLMAVAIFVLASLIVQPANLPHSGEFEEKKR